MIEASIIIPTRNRAPWLGQALASFAGQSFPRDRYEILVVDNGSTDRTADLVRTAISRYAGHGIRYFFESIPGLLSGRHRGAAEAAGGLLVFVDDDIEAAPGWLAGIVDAFKDPDVHLAGGPSLPKFEVAPPRWLEGYWVKNGGRIECSALSLIYMGDQAKAVDPDHIWGLNYAIRKSTLYEAGGFHPDCVPKEIQCFQGDGESGLSLKIREKGYGAVYVPQARVVHHIPRTRLTVAYFEERYFYQGVCESFTQIRKHRAVGKGRLSFHPPLADGEENGSAYGAYRQIIHGRLEQAHRAGFDFHQAAVAGSPVLLDWVLKPDYFDYHPPELSPKQGTHESLVQPAVLAAAAVPDRKGRAGLDGAHPLRPVTEKALTPAIAAQLDAFEKSPPEERQSTAERSQKPWENLEYFVGLRDRLASAGVAIRDAVIDRADFDRWRADFPEIVRFYRPAGEVFIEKCLEHYLVFRYLGLDRSDTYIDVAAAQSPWADALKSRGGAAYRMDLNYPSGIHGMNIGADAGATGLPDAFCTALSLQCAFECFMGDADQRFVREASRILAPGGRLAIAPLYLESSHFITTSPLIDQKKVVLDAGARRVWRDDAYVEPFSRMYSPEAFVDRIWRILPQKLDAEVIFFTNLGELLSYYKGQRIYCFFMMLAEKTAQ